MKRILVTGASGLLGLNFCHFYHRKFDLVGLSNRNSVSNAPFKMLSVDLEKTDITGLVSEIKPDIILHCAAIANIDVCEKEPVRAKIVNSEIPGRLAAAAGKQGVKFIHISTDAVFDGEGCGPDGYRETDPTNPISRYAETKLLGEENVLTENPDALAARVNFYGWSMGGKRSLAEFFYNNLSSETRIKGFDDVYFCSLYVRKLTDLLLEIAEQDAKGIYHVFSSDHQSKYSFGVTIAKLFGLAPELITPVSWKDGGLNARRSPNLIMNTEKLRKLLGHTMPTQQENLENFHTDFMNGIRKEISNYSA